MGAAVRFQDACRELCRHPFRTIVLRWNWKSALLSPLARGAFILAANARGGVEAAVGTLTVEVLYRSTISGFAATASREQYWFNEKLCLGVCLAEQVAECEK
jgi:hypothetical protein